MSRRIILVLFLILLAAFCYRVVPAPVALWIKLISGLLFSLLILVYLSFSDPPWARSWKGTGSKSVGRQMVPSLWLWLVFTVYACLLGVCTVEGTLSVLLYLLSPVLLVSLNRSRLAGLRPRLSPLLVVAILGLWLPLEFEWLPTIGVPPEGGIPVVLLLGVISALYAFGVVAELPGIGYTFLLRRQDWKQALVCFCLFTSIFAVPLGVGLGFVASSAEVIPVWQWPLLALAVFFFTALPEELLFRAIILNLFNSTWEDRPRLMLGVSAVVFGLAHANNSNPPLLTLHVPGYGGVEFPWVYVLLSTIAGWFYGRAYLESKKVTTSAVVHALVNTWWAVFFKG